MIFDRARRPISCGLTHVALIIYAVVFAASTLAATTVGAPVNGLETAGAAAAVSSRIWSFSDTDVKGVARNWQMEGSYLRTDGCDSPVGLAYVVLRLSDGRIKSYPLRNFSTADKAYVAMQPKRVYAPDPEKYVANFDQYNPSNDAAMVNFHETPHFVFYWGKHIAMHASKWDDPAFREMNFKYFEEIWDFNAQMLHAPMPYEGQEKKLKVNVYIPGTGLPKHDNAYAQASDCIVMHPASLLEGSSVVPHEFTHVIQLYSGGFRDDANVGWIWEAHANWNRVQFFPAYAAALPVYAERMHYELCSTRMNYGSWPFLEFLSEDPRFGTQFCFDIWRHNKRDAKGATLETPFQTMMRLGVEKGVFRGDGVEGFGDVIGQVAAHNVTWDYVIQYSITRELDGFYNTLSRPTSERVVLHELPDKPNTYSPLYSQAPRQYGINIINLTPDPMSQSVTVNFDGIPNEVEGSDWRLTLVAIGDNRKARYSPMWRTGSQTMTLQSDEHKVSLAIAATPTIYRVQEFRPGFNAKARHTYEVSFKGAKPTALLNKPKWPEFRGAAHTNGGGFVERGAIVSPTAYVGPNARVLGGTKVLEGARIEDNATVRDYAVVSGHAIVCGNAVVGGRCKITEQSRVRGYAHIGDEVTLKGNARVLEYAKVYGNGSVGGDALIKGFGEVNTSSNAPIGGGVILGEDLEVHTGGFKAPINFGLIYGFNEAGILRTALKDNHYLYAHWDFNKSRKHILLDTCADNNGVLRGATLPTYLDGALSFDGSGQYVLVGGSVVDTVDMIIDLRLTWTGGANQCVFMFGDDKDHLFFTPQARNGKPGFAISKGDMTQTLFSTVALPQKKATRVVIALQGDQGRILIDGQLVGTSRITLNPEDLRAEWGTIGAAPKGTWPFKGSIDDVAVYRTGDLTAIGEIR